MHFTKEILEPKQCAAIEPSLKHPTWVYRYRHPSRPWILSIATQGEAGSETFSLGGFRIVPAALANQPGFDNDREACRLADGMTKKVSWSKLTGIAAPLTKPVLGRLVGGKCVILPDEQSRVGHPNDTGLLDFAIDCMRDFESTAGMLLITGQDLGHGTMADGKTNSCAYINDRFKGSVFSDTSKPTGEGCFYTLKGGLKALDIPVAQSRVGLIGCGNIGGHVLARLTEEGATVAALESDPKKCQQLEARGVMAFRLDKRDEFLEQPFQALAVNANGGSLDATTIDAIIANPTIRFVTGCENLIMPDPKGAERLAAAGKIYCPPEMAGMMGYLTASEERLAGLAKKKFEIDTLFEAAKPLEAATAKVVGHMLKAGGKLTFEVAAKQVYGK